MIANERQFRINFYEEMGKRLFVLLMIRTSLSPGV